MWKSKNIINTRSIEIYAFILSSFHFYSFFNISRWRSKYSYWIPFKSVPFNLIRTKSLHRRYLFTPLSRFGVVRRNPTAAPFENQLLENAYRKSTIWSADSVLQLSKRTDCSEQQILHWLRWKRVLQSSNDKLERFSEDGYWLRSYLQRSPKIHTYIPRILKFISKRLDCLNAMWFFAYHLYVLWDKSWFWNLEHCWLNYPFQVTNSYLITHSKGPLLVGVLKIGFEPFKILSNS